MDIEQSKTYFQIFLKTLDICENSLEEKFAFIDPPEENVQFSFGSFPINCLRGGVNWNEIGTHEIN